MFNGTSLISSCSDTITIDKSRAGCCMIGVKYYKSKMGTVIQKIIIPYRPSICPSVIPGKGKGVTKFETCFKRRSRKLYNAFPGITDGIQKIIIPYRPVNRTIQQRTVTILTCDCDQPALFSFISPFPW